MNRMSVNLTHMRLVKIGIHKSTNILFTQPYKVNKMSKTRFPPIDSTVEVIALSPCSMRPKTIPKSLTQLMGCVSKGKNLLKSLPIISLLN
jgi:hypothetical protein